MNKHKTPHDSAFRASMKDPVTATHFLEAHLPKTILKKMSLETLYLMDGSFVDEQLKSKLSDLLYSVKYENENAYIYVLAEHYTQPNRFNPIFVLSYLCQIAKKLLIDKKHENKKLPRIFPLVFYHGKASPYPYSSHLIDCFDDPSFAQQYFLKGFHLVDITQIPDEDILKHKTAALMEMLQKHCYEKNLISILKTLKPTLEYLVNIGANHQISYNFKYLLEIMDSTDSEQAVQEISALLPDQLKGDIMTIAEQLRQQGIEKTALDFLMAGATEEMVKKATGFSSEKINELKRKKLKH